MEKRCQNCGKYRFCDEEETDKQDCKKWIKQPYTYLKEHDGVIWNFERVD